MKFTDAQALEALVALSNDYGSQTDYVIAGGGNTSYKNETTLWVKGSGQSLGTIRSEGFARMDRAALAALWTQEFSLKTDQREKEVLACLMAARLPGEESKRPSVETLLHDLLPFAFVVHTHPTLVNALTCGREGKAAFDRLFASEAVWIPLVDPGYVLSKVVKDALEAYRAQNGRVPAIVFLQNHGLVVAGDTPEAIRETYDRIDARLRAEVKEHAQLDPVAIDLAAESAFLAALAAAARGAYGTEVFCVRATGESVLKLAASREGFAPLSSAFTPDHIVYMGVTPLRVETATELGRGFADFVHRWGKPPRVVLFPGLGAFCLGNSAKSAGQAHLLFRDAVKIAVASGAFGGPLFMTAAAIDFIVNWEVEAFRSAVSSGR